MDAIWWIVIIIAVMISSAAVMASYLYGERKSKDDDPV